MPRKFIPTKIYNSRRVQYYGFEANGVEVQLHVDVRMRQKAGTQTTKIKSAKIYTLEIYPLYGIRYATHILYRTYHYLLNYNVV